jgi:hypothetical protein
MKNDYLVIPIEDALKLKEFALPQISHFYYEHLSNNLITSKENAVCSAFTADELLTRIPYPIEKDGFTYRIELHLERDFIEGQIIGSQIDNNEMIFSIKTDSLAILFGKLLIFLYENEYLD